jgi:hypothetical protein
MNYSLDYLLIKELRERLVEKILEEWELKWHDFPTLLDDDFILLKNHFDNFLEKLKYDIYVSLEHIIVDESERAKKTPSKPTIRRFLLQKESLPDLQNNTRNALAVYIGYNGWDEFVQNVKHFVRSRYFAVAPYREYKEKSFFGIITTQRFLQIIPDITKEQRSENEPEDVTYKEVSAFNYRRFLSFCFLLLTACVCMFYIYQWYKNRPFTEEQLAKVKFEFISQYDKPNTSTLKFIYDVSSLNTDSVTIDYGYDEFYLSGTDKIIKNQNYIEKYTKKIDTLSHTYFKPNVWVIKLIVRGKTIRTLNKIVYSGKEWTSWSSGKENQTLWVGKILSPSKSMKNGVLHFDKSDMEKQGGLDFYYTKHQINDDFSISGDSVYFEAKIRNSEIEGGFRNYDTSISFLDKNRSSMLLNIIQDCIEYGNFTIAETQFLGKKKYLPFLDINVQKWRLVGIKMKNKTATIYIDGKKIFETPYKGELAEIKGIRITFKGSGSVDWIKLSNSHNGQVVFFDDFIR